MSEAPPIAATAMPATRKGARLCRGCTHPLAWHDDDGCTYGRGGVGGGCGCERNAKSEKPAKRADGEQPDVLAELDRAGEVLVGALGVFVKAIGRALRRADEPRRVTSLFDAREPALPPPSVLNGAPLSRCAIACRDVLRRRSPCTRTELAILAGYSVESGGYAEALADLRALHHIDGPPTALAITPDGGTATDATPPLPTREELVATWIVKVRRHKNGKCCARILEEAARAWPETLSREDLAAAAGYSAESGGFAESLATLRGLALLDGTRASDALMRSGRGAS